MSGNPRKTASPPTLDKGKRRRVESVTRLETRKKTGCTEVGIIPACDLNDFIQVVDGLSSDEITAIEVMGFGPVNKYKCSQLNLALCKMMLDNFNVTAGTINIHGRHMAITPKDINRLLGLRCHGRVLDLNCLNDEVVISDLKTQICGDGDDISLNHLREIMVSSQHDDDDYGMFMVCFALYALSTMLCPTPKGDVDQRLLIPLTNPRAIRTYNWSHFVYMKLVEAVRFYQSSKSLHVGGCLLFLQLFYLSVLGERIVMVPRIRGPVMSFVDEDCNRIYKWVDGLGGLYATEGIWVTKRHTTVRSTQNSGSRDYSTGLKTNLVDDVVDLKENTVVLQDGVRRLESIARGMGPNTVCIRNALTKLEASVSKLFGDGLDDLVSEVESNVLAYLDGLNLPTPVAEETNPGGNGCEDEFDTSTKKQLKKTTGDVVEQLKKPNGSNFGGLGGRKFGNVADLSAEEKELMSYLLSMKARGCDMLGSDEIGRCGDFSVSLWDLKCLSAKNRISSEVINLMGAYFATESDDCWFLPTLFSERAQEGPLNSCAESHIASTISLCRLRRFHGQLHLCNKIFIPINDTRSQHWFLAVANIREGECEIWDSMPDSSTQQGREECVNSVMVLLQTVFAAELKDYPLLASQMASYNIVYPESNPTQTNNPDSGIFTIRNFQNYRECWHVGFNAGDQRIKLGLEIVNNPHNECLDLVMESVKIWKKGECTSLAGRSASRKEPSAAGDLGLIPCSVKFKPRVPRRS